MVSDVTLATFATQKVESDFNFAFNIRSNVQIAFSGYFEGANIFTPVFGPNKHTGEVRFCVKTMRKKHIFFAPYIICQNKPEKWEKNNPP